MLTLLHRIKEDSLIRYHVGIDVGKNKHHACVYDIVEDRYTKVFPFTVDRPDLSASCSFCSAKVR